MAPWHVVEVSALMPKDSSMSLITSRLIASSSIMSTAGQSRFSQILLALSLKDAAEAAGYEGFWSFESRGGSAWLCRLKPSPSDIFSSSSSIISGSESSATILLLDTMLFLSLLHAPLSVTNPLSSNRVVVGLGVFLFNFFYFCKEPFLLLFFWILFLVVEDAPESPISSVCFY